MVLITWCPWCVCVSVCRRGSSARSVGRPPMMLTWALYFFCLWSFKSGLNIYLFPPLLRTHSHTQTGAHGGHLTELMPCSSISAWHPRTVMCSFELIAQSIFQWQMVFAVFAALPPLLAPLTSLSFSSSISIQTDLTVSSYIVLFFSGQPYMRD